MASVGVIFNYKKEQRRSLIFCIGTSITASLPMLLLTFIRVSVFNDPIEVFAVYFSHILQYGSSLQFFMSFSHLLRKISFNFAVLNRFLRWILKTKCIFICYFDYVEFFIIILFSQKSISNRESIENVNKYS